MNLERLLREVERRLVGLGEEHRQEVLDALKEEFARERRRLDPEYTVEAERERRLEAETLREILESINRHVSLDQTMAEVVKQLSRVVEVDSCSLSLLQGDSSFRIEAVRGFPEPSRIVGHHLKNDLTDELLDRHWPVSVVDAAEDPRFDQIDVEPRIRSWAALPLLVEGQVIGAVMLDRHRVEAFDDAELHRAKTVTFSAAAAIRRSQLHDHVRRYADLMEHVVAIDHAVFAGEAATHVAELILAGALKLGVTDGGAFVVPGKRGARFVATAGEVLDGLAGQAAPGQLLSEERTRLEGKDLEALAKELHRELAVPALLLLPVATPDDPVGTLVLVKHQTSRLRDALMESYATRAAEAYLQAARG